MTEENPLRDEVFDPVLRPERERRTVSARDIEQAGGFRDPLETFRLVGPS